MTTDSTTPDPYQVLGIATDASEAQVRKAWRKKTSATGPGTSEFAALNAAAELLLDSDRRKAYDGERAAARVAEREAAAASAAAAPEATPTVDEVAPEPDDADAGQTQQGPSRSWRSAFSGWGGTVAIAGVLAVLAIALAIWQGVEYANRSTAVAGPGTGGVAAGNFAQPQSDQQAALSAVQTGLPAVLSYNYASMPASEANAARFLTPKARPALEASYQRLINGGTPPGCTKALPPIATSKTVVTATIVSSGIVSVGSGTAQIGVFVNQTTTRASQSPVTTQNRVLVSLVKQNGNWLIDSLSVPNTDHVLNC